MLSDAQPKNKNILICKKIVKICLDPLPPSRRGSHFKSDYAHPPLLRKVSTCAMIFSRCALFKVNPNHIMQRHIMPPERMTAVLKNTGTRQKWPHETYIIYICTRALYNLLTFAHYRAVSTVITLLPKATFTPSNLTLVYHVTIPPNFLPPSTPFWPYGTH